MGTKATLLFLTVAIVTLVSCTDTALLPATPIATSVSQPSAQETAKKALDDLVRLGKTQAPLNAQAMSQYLDEVYAVLKTVDGDAAVQQEFVKLLEKALGSPLPVKKSARSPGLARIALSPLAADAPPYTNQSPTWEVIKETLQNLIWSQVPAGDFLEAADPEIMRAMLTAHTLTSVMQRCIDNVEACANGNAPAFNAMTGGDIPGAFRAIY